MALKNFSQIARHPRIKEFTGDTMFIGYLENCRECLQALAVKAGQKAANRGA
jgi:hypothetical protein